MPYFLGPAGNIFLGSRIAGPNLQNLTNLNRANTLLGLQKRAWAGAAARINNFRGLYFR